jgi:hypothetical protein
MELPWLYSFTVLADLLHFGRAAAALHLSQSALSVQIRNLEASLKVTLFERDRRRSCGQANGERFRAWRKPRYKHDVYGEYHVVPRRKPHLGARRWIAARLCLSSAANVR